MKHENSVNINDATLELLLKKEEKSDLGTLPEYEKSCGLFNCDRTYFYNPNKK